jgi:hypothetical protein
VRYIFIFLICMLIGVCVCGERSLHSCSSKMRQHRVSGLLDFAYCVFDVIGATPD